MGALVDRVCLTFSVSRDWLNDVTGGLSRDMREPRHNKSSI